MTNPNKNMGTLDKKLTKSGQEKNRYFVWIFQDSFQNPGNPNRNLFFYYLDFADFMICSDFAGFEYFRRTNPNKTKTVFC
jgi:hypothetical protein